MPSALVERVTAAGTNGSRARSVRAPDGERPVTEVVGDIVQNLNSLVLAEARLAVAEAVDKVTSGAKASSRGAAIAAAGASLCAIALGGIFAAAAAALALVMAGWAAILIVAAAAGIGGGLAISIGARHLRRALSPIPAPNDAKEPR